MLRLLSCLALVPACGIADFDVDQPIVEQQIAGSPLPGPLATLFPLQLDLDISQKIKAMDTGPIDSVTLKSLTLTITKTDEPSGDTDDWSFVDSVQVYVSSSALPKVEIAHATAPGAVRTLEMELDDVNLKPYIDAGGAVESTGSGTAPADDVSFAGSATFTVHPL